MDTINQKKELLRDLQKFDIPLLDDKLYIESVYRSGSGYSVEKCPKCGNPTKRHITVLSIVADDTNLTNIVPALYVCSNCKVSVLDEEFIINSLNYNQCYQFPIGTMTFESFLGETASFNDEKPFIYCDGKPQHIVNFDEEPILLSEGHLKHVSNQLVSEIKKRNLKRNRKKMIKKSKKKNRR